MANNIRVHTDANFRIRDGLGTVMRSSRMLNQNNCMQDRSLRRNIISNHFVQPYTKKFDDGTCDYNIARAAELQSNNLQYHFRPQNMEEQMGLGNDYTHSVTGSNLDKIYNLNGSGSTLVNPNLNFSQSSSYYPYAYGGDLSGVGSGVQGGFNHSANHGPNYEPYTYMPVSPPQNLLGGPGQPQARNFGSIPPNNAGGANQTPQHYTPEQAGLSYMNVDTNRQFNRANAPRGSGVAMIPENFMNQPQPRNGYYGFERDFYF